MVEKNADEKNADEKNADEKNAVEMNAENFRSCLEKTFEFSVNDGDQKIPCQLIEVRTLTGDTKRPDSQPFSLLFRGPAEAAFEQGTFRITQEFMGDMDIFIVTVGPDPDADGMLHEAVFT